MMDRLVEKNKKLRGGELYLCRTRSRNIRYSSFTDEKEAIALTGNDSPQR
jgi:hypothetical protein